MNRPALGLIWAILLVGCACTQDNAGSQDDTLASSSKVDPMFFVMLYQSDFERLLKKHVDDCEGALAALMRFVADHRQAFCEQVKGKPPDWQPRETRSHRNLDLLMEFSARCPDQAARLNQAIHTIGDATDGPKL